MRYYNKKKIIFAVATGLFALATVFNMSVLQSNNAGDVSLDAITVMAQAQSSENPPSSEKYGSLTTPCYDKKGNPTGKNRKSCFSGGTLDSCKPHGCQ
ncbi:MAG TPA: hypothetical protein VLZ83_12115 [Edaphocola sp.]|nr:hypothetical protein [Edaphocola sp.]